MRAPSTYLAKHRCAVVQLGWRHRCVARLAPDTFVVMQLHPDFRQALARERQRDFIAAADRHRMLRRSPERPRVIDAGGEITIRLAAGDEATALWRLAVLDSARALDDAVLVGKVDGVLVAACELGSGRMISDPFRRTETTRRLLELRRGQIVGTALPVEPTRRSMLRRLVLGS